jgi:peroxiredoxin
MGWDFEVLLDPNGELQRALNVTNPPATFLVDKKGKITYTHTGYVERDEYQLEDHIKEIKSISSLHPRSDQVYGKRHQLLGIRED